MTKEITSKQQLNELRRFFRRHIKAEIIIIVCMIVFIEVLFIGNIAYGVKWIACGKQPVIEITDSTFPIPNTEPTKAIIITHPGFFEEKRSLIPDGYNLFCSSKEAMRQARQDVSGNRQNIEAR